MYRYRELLTSFLASAMLTTALIPVPGAASLASVFDPAAAQRALSMVMAHAPAGYEGGAVPSVEPTLTPVSVTVTAPAPAITPARITEINTYARRHGYLTEVGPRTGGPLGLVTPGVPYMSRQTVIEENATPRRHVWAVHEGNGTKILVFTYVGRDASMWVFEMDGTLVSAAVAGGGVFTVIPVDQGRATFEAEMRLWSELDLSAPPTQVASRPGP